jgi:ribonuclease R
MKTALTALLKEIEKAYEQSDIRQYCLEHGHQWFYSLVSTTMEVGGPLIIGFNWGASKDEKYDPQLSIEKCDFKSGDRGSLSRIFPYCEEFIGRDFLSTVSQSNYCFFRSKNERQISNKDMELCEPIFEKLLAVMKPSLIICFSSKLRDYMLRNNKIRTKTSKSIRFDRGYSVITYDVIKATLLSGTKIFFLPHPNYPMKAVAREEVWDFCFGKGQ